MNRLQWINMKSNRLAFLSDLNQFENTRHSVQTTDARVERAFTLKSPSASLRSPNNEGLRSQTEYNNKTLPEMKSQSDGFYPTSDYQQEHSPEFKNNTNPFTQPPPAQRPQSGEKQKTLEPNNSSSKFSLKLDGSSNKSSPFSKISERSDGIFLFL